MFSDELLTILLSGEKKNLILLFKKIELFHIIFTNYQELEGI